MHARNGEYTETEQTGDSAIRTILSRGYCFQSEGRLLLSERETDRARSFEPTSDCTNSADLSVKRNCEPLVTQTHSILTSAQAPTNRESRETIKSPSFLQMREVPWKSPIYPNPTRSKQTGCRKASPESPSATAAKPAPSTSGPTSPSSCD